MLERLDASTGSTICTVTKEIPGINALKVPYQKRFQIIVIGDSKLGTFSKRFIPRIKRTYRFVWNLKLRFLAAGGTEPTNS